jgi:spermidine/putrescine-binding protein
VADKIESIEKEIKKIEDRLGKLKKNKAEPELDKNIQLATVSVLKNVIKDLRQQQQKLTKSKDQEQ